MHRETLVNRMAASARATQRWASDNSAVLLSLAAVAMLAYINCLFGFYTQYRIGLVGDSEGYVAWYPLRTPGYPAFIHALLALTGDLRWLGVVQLNLLLCSFLALSYGFGHLTGSRLAGLAALLLLCTLLPLVKFSMLVMTESVFAAFICFHLAALCFCLRRTSVLPALCLGATLPLLYMVRPGGALFAAGLLLLFTPPRKSRRKQGAAQTAGGGRRPADCGRTPADGVNQQGPA